MDVNHQLTGVNHGLASVNRQLTGVNHGLASVNCQLASVNHELASVNGVKTLAFIAKASAFTTKAGGKMARGKEILTLQ